MQTGLFPASIVPRPFGTREDSEKTARLGQYMTPDWAALELVEHYFGDLGSQDAVVEPSCGLGAFLRALPSYVPAVGVEIDPELAALAHASTGREIIVGDFRTSELPFTPTAVIGNPPFAKRTIMDFLDRSWDLLPDEGRVGMILPAFVFQTASTIDTLTKRWHLRQDMIPRTNLYPKLRHPLCFAMLRKGASRGLVGFTLYHEAVAVQRLKQRYKALLAQGEGSVWAAVTRAALEVHGGKATLEQLYTEIQGNQPTSNQFWKAKVRQTLQRIAVRVGQGTWSLPIDPAVAVAA